MTPHFEFRRSVNISALCRIAARQTRLERVTMIGRNQYRALAQKQNRTTPGKERRQLKSLSESTNSAKLVAHGAPRSKESRNRRRRNGPVKLEVEGWRQTKTFALFEEGGRICCLEVLSSESALPHTPFVVKIPILKPHTEKIHFITSYLSR